MNAKTEAAVMEHGRNLLAVFPHATERDPVKLCKRLRKLERKGAALALRLCNGPEFAEGKDDEIEAAIMAELDGLLYYKVAHVPVFLNRDPRGYALKIDEAWMRVSPASAAFGLGEERARLYKDFGGYGIIAPDLTEN
jgi:hypothetical protein